ncbi:MULTISPECIES: hypothetical protein [Streptomyces]|nr:MULTISPECIES: hypothetical protein [Streptomyces]
MARLHYIGYRHQQSLATVARAIAGAHLAEPVAPWWQPDGPGR